MNIVVLDGYTLNPGDLSWDGLRRLGSVEVYDRTPAEQIVERAQEAEIIFTNKTPLHADTLRKLPKLRYIGVLATGYDVVDCREAAELGIPVANVPGYGSDSVAQTVFALVLELCHHVGLHDQSVKAGEWARNADFCYWRKPLVELRGKTMGIIGYGRIGEQVARIAAAFGMNVLANRRSMTDPPSVQSVTWADRDRLLEQSDIVSLHCPLTVETEGWIRRDTLRRMKSSAFLINTARGKIINERDLVDALNEGWIAGAGLDVLSSEPPAPDNPLLTARHCVITPHVAWATKEARERLLLIALDNLQAYLDGKSRNVVNQ